MLQLKIADTILWVIAQTQGDSRGAHAGVVEELNLLLPGHWPSMLHKGAKFNRRQSDGLHVLTISSKDKHGPELMLD